MATLSYPETRESKIQDALNEVKQIKSGKIARRTARDFLRSSRNE